MKKLLKKEIKRPSNITQFAACPACSQCGTYCTAKTSTFSMQTTLKGLDGYTTPWKYENDK